MTIPYGIYIISVLAVLFFLYLRIEKASHDRVLEALPIRIWVNGTRGKSSVTRLIAAGIRSKKIRVIAKTTGTKARFILDNRHEEPVDRISQANIHEQMSILKKACGHNPAAVVLECMALRPDLQFAEAQRIVKPNIVVITNVRADHLDVMGPTLKDMAHNFVNALPPQCQVVTTEKDIFAEFAAMTDRKGIRITTVDADSIDDAVMMDFKYLEHKENVALALEVSAMIGADRKEALKSMQNSLPDPGALRMYSLRLKGKNINLVNAMAANDPDSTYLIWKSTKVDEAASYVLINCRADRIDRSFQMAKLIKEHLAAKGYILTGQATDILVRALAGFVPKQKLVNLGNQEPEAAVQKIADFVSDNSVIFAIGNTVGYGEKLIDEFIAWRVDAAG